MNKKKVILLIIGILLLVGCGSKKEKYDLKIMNFSYSYGSHEEGYCDYSLSLKNGEVLYSAYGNGKNYTDINETIDDSYLDQLFNIIKENNVDDWNGFNKQDDDIEDGRAFSLEIGYSDGTNISASGYMVYPSNYEKVHELLMNYFSSIK